MNERDAEPHGEPDGIKAFACDAQPELASGRATQAPYIYVEIFENNIDAFERYYDISVRYPDLFSGADLDGYYELGDRSPWNAAQITAQDTTTSQSAGEVVTTAVMLGDFYTVEILVRFEPGRLMRADCDADSAEDCTMTAAHMAEFLATDSYLEDLHAAIEATFDRET